jgi:hypothetical protein
VQHLHLVADDAAHGADIEPAVGVEEHDAHARQEAAHALVHEGTAVRRGVHEQLAAGVDGADDVGGGARVRHIDHADRCSHGRRRRPARRRAGHACTVPPAAAAARADRPAPWIQDRRRPSGRRGRMPAPPRAGAVAGRRPRAARGT